MVRQYILRKDGEYDVLETSIDDLDFSQLKEYELHLLRCVQRTRIVISVTCARGNNLGLVD